MTLADAMRRVPTVGWAACAGALWLLVLMTLSARIAAKSDTIKELEASRDQIAARSLDRAALESRIRMLSAIPEDVTGIMQETSEDAAQARFQSMIVKLTEKSGFVVSSMQKQPSRKADGVILLKANALLRGDTNKFKDLIEAIETSSPAMMVSEFDAFAADPVVGPASPDRSATASLTAQAFLFVGAREGAGK
ncbi:Type II secretion system (T2SS), protein M subtype b [Rhizobiales bacterium GAS191]|nr:Type II secretion system (T2SS), protein M subtype b [Rhizobiales bacterium GAS191]